MFVNSHLHFIAAHGDLVSEDHLVTGEVEIQLAGRLLVDEVVVVSVFKAIRHVELGGYV